MQAQSGQSDLLEHTGMLNKRQEYCKKANSIYDVLGLITGMVLPLGESIFFVVNLKKKYFYRSNPIKSCVPTHFDESDRFLYIRYSNTSYIMFRNDQLFQDDVTVARDHVMTKFSHVTHRNHIYAFTL